MPDLISRTTAAGSQWSGRFRSNEHYRQMTEYVLAYARPTFSQNLGVIYEVQRLHMLHSDDEAAVRSLRFAVPRAYALVRDGVEHRALALMLWRVALPADVLIWERQD